MKEEKPIGGTELTNHAAVKVRADAAVQIVANGGGAVELLLLQVGLTII